MECLDHTYPTPAENLACDEALLDRAEHGESGEILRFWESSMLFVVLGQSNRFRIETIPEACASARIPILRRCTGGGTVLQGPGCLNYTLILSLERRPDLETVTRTNRHVMHRNAACLQPLVDRPIAVQGITDLTLDGRKFSGNAQRRRRRFTLFHGTILVDFDLELVSRFLPPPSRQPDYRRDRVHTEFLTSIGVARDTIQQAMRAGWNANHPSLPPPHERVRHLVLTKYDKPDWNLKS